MKNRKTRIICISALAVILTAAIIIAVSPGKNAKQMLPETDAGMSAKDTEPEISVQKIEKDNEAEKEKTDSREQPAVKTGNQEAVVKPDETAAEARESAARVYEPVKVSSPVSPEPVREPEKAEETRTPAGPEITYTEPEETYSCGVSGHHCGGPETHAYISNLENEGCRYCGSHSCPSFYAADEWGNGCYDPSLCPQYTVTGDPLYYCQECGRQTGDGTDGTCVRFIQECDCPNCGEHVLSRECHTCG